MATFSWLHLTDLHVGMGAQQQHWPDVEEALFDDLPKLHAKSGPWDFVLFTGDLTNHGTDAHFALASTRLDALMAELRHLGSDPVLVAVPGNHDLVRPDAPNAAVDNLRRWNDDAALRERFWRDAATPERQVVTRAFEPFTTFQRARPMPTWLTVREGLLPGDVSLSFEREGLRVALVGLNSAFLHLGDDAEEKLALEIEQLQGVCGDNPPRWLREHHVALLLTHHPRAWLHPRAREIFDASIVGRDRFTAHLYGHMHEVAMARHAVGGSPERRTVQGPSLFGLETFDDGRQQRIHGYVAGRITVLDGRGTLQLWPRLRERMNAGYYNLVPAYALDLTDEAVTFPFTPRAVRNAIAAPAVSPTAVPTPADSSAPPRNTSAQLDAFRRLEPLTDAQFDSLLAVLSVQAREAPGDRPTARALALVQHLDARGRLHELDAAVAGVLAAPVAAVTEPAAVTVSDRELRAALCRYFDAVPRIRMLLRDAGVETTRVDFAQGAALVWDAALPELRRARRLGALLTLACEEYPEADDLRALASRVTD